jgi:hypothetical protein
MRTTHRLFALAAAMLMAALTASAQEPARPGPSLDRLAGTWVLTGTIEGKPTTHDVDAEWVLHRGYLRLHEVSRERDAKGGPAYEAIVFIGWDQGTGEYSCLWLDTTSGAGLSNDGIARGRPAGDRIPFLFKTSGGDVFHNTFVYSSANDTWQWIMDGEANGKLQPFARLTLARK